MKNKPLSAKSGLFLYGPDDLQRDHKDQKDVHQFHKTTSLRKMFWETANRSVALSRFYHCFDLPATKNPLFRAGFVLH